MVTKRHKVTEILVTFSGAVNVNEAQGLGEYSLVMAGNHGSFTARNAKKIKLRTASYNATTDTVTLIPRKAFALTKKVQLEVDGVPPSGLQDSLGRLIDGDRSGQPGSNAIAILARGGVSLPAATSASPPSGVTPIVVDALLQLNALADVTSAGSGGRKRR